MTIRLYSAGSALLWALIAAPTASRTANAYQYPVQVTAYGAKCDGSTDDTMSIQAAILGAGSGGTVQFPSGVCIVSGTQSIVLSDIALIGAEVPHWSDATSSSEAGTVISIGTTTTNPGPQVPFLLKHSVALRGLNFVYPAEIASCQATPCVPISSPTLFSDDGTDEVSNILFQNVHVIAPYAFWIQQSSAPVYGNIRFSNTDVYAVYKVFDWSSVAETVFFDNFISNPSLCSGGYAQCSKLLQSWTGDNGVWFHVGSTPSCRTTPPKGCTHVGGLLASNLAVVGYKVGILIDGNGHLDESVFGSTSVFDGVPYVLSVNVDGSITHTVFKSKIEFSGQSLGGTVYTNPAFILDQPQFPLDNVQDFNSITLDGVTADGLGGSLISVATLQTKDNIASIVLSGLVVRHYCDGGTSNAADINASTTAVIITGSQITTNKSACGGLNITSSFYVNTGNIVGYHAGLTE